MLVYSDNLKQWQATLKEYASFSQLDWAEVCNKKALDLLFKCIKNTPKASPGLIKTVPFYLSKHIWYGQVVKWMKEHGGIGIEARPLINKRGKSKGGRRVKSIASWRYTVGQASRKIIGSRLSAVGFIRSGWMAALGQMLATLGIKGRRKSYGSGKIFGSPKGYAVRAKPGFKPFAIVANTTASYASSHGGSTSSTHSSGSPNRSSRVHDIIKQGAAAAMAESDADMRKYIEGIIKDRIRYFTGR